MGARHFGPCGNSPPFPGVCCPFLQQHFRQSLPLLFSDADLGAEQQLGILLLLLSAEDGGGDEQENIPAILR